MNPISRRQLRRASRTQPVVKGIAAACVAASALWCASASLAADQPVVGLITKTDTNPFFVKMKQGAESAAQKDGAKLLTAAGKFDGDNAAQVTAIENMITAGAKAILITPSDT
jgi:fructose transport system substrate-binding protein